MKKKAWAVWQGGIKDGGGSISTETGVLRQAPYGFKARFENGPGTNPEELIGAAHAGCFTMALSMMLTNAGFKPDHLETHAEVTLDKEGEGYAITSSHLTLKAKILGIDQEKFSEIANMAKAECPVSKVLKAKLSLDATLEA